ncbi:MAG: 30S ribosomal protein S12 methylthiotransferase RimO, partial [Eubacteriales bacterium]|nr:30S ribosomal protein S12 methylthiotransferase RimO [Eubacteriales bacterium]
LTKDSARPEEAENWEASSFELDSEYRTIPADVYSASIRIAEGCNRKCAYCVIPNIRGPYRSRTMESVLSEAERLAEAGTKELSVIAEDTGCYGADLYGKPMLSELLRKLCRIEGIQWIRLMYCYEDHIDDSLIKVMAEEPKICHYIDMPLQHASDSVLKEMNRSTTNVRMRSTIQKLREAMPDITIRTTMIVGFPGETEEEFQELLDFCAEIRFDRLGAFTYSREEGAPAAERTDQIPEEVKESRLDRLMSQQMEISLENNQRQIGKIAEVIVDGKDEDGVSYIGRTRRDAPEIDDSVLFSSERELIPGQITRVKITDAFDYDLEGMEV